jgi:hypothetical protein
VSKCVKVDFQRPHPRMDWIFFADRDHFFMVLLEARRDVHEAWWGPFYMDHLLIPGLPFLLVSFLSIDGAKGGWLCSCLWWALCRFLYGYSYCRRQANGRRDLTGSWSAPARVHGGSNTDRSAATEGGGSPTAGGRDPQVVETVILDVLALGIPFRSFWALSAYRCRSC